jgi:glycine cleavage system H lipoate-binding protein
MNKAISPDGGKPQLINRDPLGKGWIIRMEVSGKNIQV